MRSFLILGLMMVAMSGCRSRQGDGLWNLRVGGDAVLVSTGEAGIALERLAATEPRRRGPKRSIARQTERTTFPAGTVVVILAIDGDDARVQIKEGDKSGSIYWVECSHLEPATQ